jgi:hypothetical protein
MRLEVMRQLENPTSPSATCVLQESAERRSTVIGIVAYTRNLLSICEPPTAINAFDGPREWAGGTNASARSSTIDT